MQATGVFKRSRCGRPGSEQMIWTSAADLEGATILLASAFGHGQSNVFFHAVLGIVPAAAASCFSSAVTSCPSSDCRPAPARQARRRTDPDQVQSIYISDSSSSADSAKAVRKRRRRSRSPPQSGTQNRHHSGAQQHTDDAQLEAMLAGKAVR